MTDDATKPISEQDDGLVILGSSTEGVALLPDLSGSMTPPFLTGKTEVQVDAVAPISSQPGAYYLIMGNTYARITLAFPFAGFVPATTEGATGEIQTRAPLPEQVVFVKPPQQSCGIGAVPTKVAADEDHPAIQHDGMQYDGLRFRAESLLAEGIQRASSKTLTARDCSAVSSGQLGELAGRAEPAGQPDRG